MIKLNVACCIVAIMVGGQLLGCQSTTKKQYSHPPDDQPPSTEPHDLLKIINEARATGRLCGTTFYPAAPALRWHNALYVSAHRHAQDMATRNYFEHQDKQGNQAPERAETAGYVSIYVGENLGAGYLTARAAVYGWLASTEHCANLMNAHYQDVGLAYAYNPKSHWKRYWVMNLGRRL